MDHETTTGSPGFIETLGQFLIALYGVSPFSVPPQLVFAASPVSLFPGGLAVPNRGVGDTKNPWPAVLHARQPRATTA